jgi:hypothetical protein
MASCVLDAEFLLAIANSTVRQLCWLVAKIAQFADDRAYASIAMTFRLITTGTPVFNYMGEPSTTASIRRTRASSSTREETSVCMTARGQALDAFLLVGSNIGPITMKIRLTVSMELCLWTGRQFQRAANGMVE